MSDLVQFQNTVKVHIKISKIIEDVVKTLCELPDFNTKLRLDPEIIVYCCNIYSVVVYIIALYIMLYCMLLYYILHLNAHFFMYETTHFKHEKIN